MTIVVRCYHQPETSSHRPIPSLVASKASLCPFCDGIGTELIPPYVNDQLMFRDQCWHDLPGCSGCRESPRACPWCSARTQNETVGIQKQELISWIRTIQNTDSTCEATLCKLTDKPDTGGTGDIFGPTAGGPTPLTAQCLPSNIRLVIRAVD